MKPTHLRYEARGYRLSYDQHCVVGCVGFMLEAARLSAVEMAPEGILIR